MTALDFTNLAIEQAGAFAERGLIDEAIALRAIEAVGLQGVA